MIVLIITAVNFAKMRSMLFSSVRRTITVVRGIMHQAFTAPNILLSVFI